MVDFYTPQKSHKIRTWGTNLVNTILTTLNLNGTVKKIFGTWVWKAPEIVYQADTDGIIHAFGWPTTNNSYLKANIRTDAGASPTLIRANLFVARDRSGIFAGSSVSCCVKKGDYWELYATGSGGPYTLACYWLPIGE